MTQDQVPIGITMAAAQGEYTRYQFDGEAGLGYMSVSCDFTTPEPANFTAELASAPIGVLGFDELTASAHMSHRSPARMAAVPWDVVQVLYLEEGVIRAQQNGNSATFHPGELSFLRTASEFRYVTNGPVRATSISIPTNLLGHEGALVDSLLAKNLHPDSLVSTLSGFITSLNAGPPSEDTRASEFIALALVDLTRAIISAQLGLKLAPADAENGLRVQVRDYIVNHLTDADLRPVSIAASLNISVRYLHSLFESEHQTISRYIRSLRAQHLTRAFASSTAPLSALYAGSGFSSIDSASRAFHAENGMGAAEYRAAQRR